MKLRTNCLSFMDSMRGSFKVRRPMIGALGVKGKKFKVKDSVIWNKKHKAIVIQTDVDLHTWDKDRGYTIEFVDPNLCPPQMACREEELELDNQLSLWDISELEATIEEVNNLYGSTGQSSINVDTEVACPNCGSSWKKTPSMGANYWYDCTKCGNTKENILKSRGIIK